MMTGGGDQVGLLQVRNYATARAAALQITFRVLEKLRLRGYFELWRAALKTEGWSKSNRLGLSVAADGSPLPWYTYSAIHFLEPRLRNDLNVFEYGSGHSTLWYAARVGQVLSVEDNPSWASRIRETAPPNVKLSIPSSADPATYAGSIDETEASPFDIIVIDGRHRDQCADAAVRHLKPHGVIVWDNSERDDFNDKLRTLYEPLGFRALHFVGIGPIVPWTWRTSILYRDNNCLSI